MQAHFLRSTCTHACAHTYKKPVDIRLLSRTHTYTRTRIHTYIQAHLGHDHVRSISAGFGAKGAHRVHTGMYHTTRFWQRRYQVSWIVCKEGSWLVCHIPAVRMLFGTHIHRTHTGGVCMVGELRCVLLVVSWFVCKSTIVTNVLSLHSFGRWAWTHACIYTRGSKFKRTCMHACIHTYIHNIYIYIYIYIYVYTYVRTYIRTYVYTYIHVYTHVRTYTHT